MANIFCVYRPVKECFHDIFVIHCPGRTKRFKAHNLAAIWGNCKFCCCWGIPPYKKMPGIDTGCTACAFWSRLRAGGSAELSWRAVCEQGGGGGGGGGAGGLMSVLWCGDKATQRRRRVLDKRLPQSRQVVRQPTSRPTINATNRNKWSKNSDQRQHRRRRQPNLPLPRGIRAPPPNM